VLEAYLRNRLKQKEILLMTHIVLGYPSFSHSYRMVEAMVDAGVDLMELQIPFSEPIADGPVILHANQKALAAGATVQQCLDFGRKVTTDFDIPFLFMTYYNILFKLGVQRFAAEVADRGLHGSIIPDLPPEEGSEYIAAMQAHGLAPIFIFSPTSPVERMRYLASFGGGFIYCVARKGVTGSDTSFSNQLQSYIQRCREATELPLALGFGVKDAADVEFLKGKVDIAVIGTQTIRVMEDEGLTGVRKFVGSLR
jgi:tryptophan synthase alpha chain